MVHEVLEGIRVLDMTMWQLGPVNTMMLATMGADVIKIETPVGEIGRWITTGGILKGSEGKGPFGKPLSAYFETNNRLKKSIVLDLTKPKAREVLYQLVTKSDVFMQNMRYGVAKKLGADYETLKKYNPKLIYCSGTSYGTRGMDATKPGMDLSGCARSGWMYMTGTENGDPIWALPGSSDQIGAIFGSYGIIVALLARERFGIGQEIETSHLTGSMWLMGDAIQMRYYSMAESALYAPRNNAAMPLFNYYKCKDSNWLALVCPTGRHWLPVCEALGIPPSIYKDDPRFTTDALRFEHRKETIVLLDEYFLKKTREDHIKSFEGKDIFWERIQRHSDLENDPQVIANEYMSDYVHPLTGSTYKYQNLPFQLRGTPCVKMGRAPMVGEHTEQILIDLLGYKKEDIPRLLDEIGRPTPPIIKY